MGFALSQAGCCYYPREKEPQQKTCDLFGDFHLKILFL
jgi:hypothetical protein